MLFTDLDRTIIFSTRIMNPDGDVPVTPNHLLGIEKKGDVIISYVTTKIDEYWNTMVKKNLVIPVTARKPEEINRISWFQRKWPEWVVAESGAVMFHKGERVVDWDKIVQEQINITVSNGNEIKKKFSSWSENLHVINENMWMVKTDTWTKEEEFSRGNQSDWFEKRGYRLYWQKRKVYCIPTCITKGTAVSHLIQKLNVPISLSAGDAQMDESMLEMTDFSIAPKHHTLSTKRILITKSKGIRAGEEILRFALDKMIEEGVCDVEEL